MTTQFIVKWYIYSFLHRQYKNYNTQCIYYLLLSFIIFHLVCSSIDAPKYIELFPGRLSEYKKDETIKIYQNFSLYDSTVLCCHRYDLDTLPIHLTFSVLLIGYFSCRQNFAIRSLLNLFAPFCIRVVWHWVYSGITLKNIHNCLEFSCRLSRE